MLIDYEKQLVVKLQEGDKKAFSAIFSKYYPDLVIFARSFTKNPEFSEEIVQEVFVKLWEHRYFMLVSVSLKSYLLKVTQNKCLDWLKHQKVKDGYQQIAPFILELSENNTDNYILYSELQERFDKVLNTLPVEIAEAFRLSRFEGMKYHDIAKKQDVSVRMIEVRVGKALHLLRDALKDYLVCFLFF